MNELPQIAKSVGRHPLRFVTGWISMKALLARQQSRIDPLLNVWRDRGKHHRKRVCSDKVTPAVKYLALDLLTLDKPITDPPILKILLCQFQRGTCRIYLSAKVSQKQMMMETMS
jgi:hypothetical protein